MNYLDILLLFPLLWGVYKGFTKGLIISVASLLALILGIYAAIHFSSNTGVYIDRWFKPDPRYLKALSFAISFLLVLILVKLIGWGLDKFIKALALGFLNRISGVVFNLLKWSFILSVLISLIESGERTKNIINENVKSESFFYKPLSRLAPIIFPYLKFESLKEKIINTPAGTEDGKQI